MFKRILTFVAASVAAMSLVACQDDSKPTIEFERILYTVYQKGSVDVALTISEPASSALTVPLIFSGNAEKGTDYEVSAESITIAPGETSGTVTVRDKGLNEEKQISLGFTAPVGYNIGTKLVAVVSPDMQEGLVYSFALDRAYAHESLIAIINVTGTVSGKDFKATEDITVPLTISGPGASYLESTDTGAQNYAVIKAGDNKATAQFKVSETFSGDENAVLTVNTNDDSRFIPGDNHSVSIAVRGVQTPDKLIGTWKFNKIFDLDELNEFFAEMEDDIDALPTHNDGFTLTFAKEADGSVSLTPGVTGDFKNFFRKATVKLAAPMNSCAKAITLGKYTAYELNQFLGNTSMVYQFNTYYELSSANRSFSSTSESLGKATVVFNLVDDGLVMELRDYNEPPFGEMWADGWTKFDPELFGFASLFTKEK